MKDTSSLRLYTTTLTNHVVPSGEACPWLLECRSVGVWGPYLGTEGIYAKSGPSPAVVVTDGYDLWWCKLQSVSRLWFYGWACFTEEALGVNRGFRCETILLFFFKVRSTPNGPSKRFFGWGIVYPPYTNTNPPAHNLHMCNEWLVMKFIKP